MKLRHFWNGRSFPAILSLLYIWCTSVSCNGVARQLNKGSDLGPPVVGDGGTRSDGNNFGQIYTVTTIVEATDDIPEWTDADLPFTSGRNAWNVETQNRQWPFKFNFTYPSNNYKLGEARISIVTQRDNSDTEAIYVDGVMTGRPPGGNVSATSGQVNHRYYTCTGCAGPAPSTPANTYFMDWALTHYKVGTKNSFDLNILDLMSPTTVKPVDVVNDGVVRVVTGDDAAVFDNYNSYWNKPLLVMEGFTISKTALTCSNSSNFRFINTYIHNDGNSIGQATFSSGVVSPVDSWNNAMAGFRAVEFYFDPRLPRVPVANIDLDQANLVLQVKRAVSGFSAIVVNGVGVSEVGFDTSSATSAIERWEAGTIYTNYWATVLSGIPADNSTRTVTINLLSLLGESVVKDLLAQGKLNVSVAGALATVQGGAATSTRTYGVQVAGPELVMRGEYFTQVCQIPNDPGSPLSDNAATPGSCALDQTSPTVSSVQVTGITSTGATIQWLTNEGADSQIGYGISSTSTTTALDATLSSFHSVQLTGLDPYKYYQYVVRSKDNCGNLTISSARSFRTLR